MSDFRAWFDPRRHRGQRASALSIRSDDSATGWAAHNVRIHSTGVKLLHHPVVGDLDLPDESLPVVSEPSTSLVVSPQPDSAAHDALALLANWAASEADHDRPTKAPLTKAHRAIEKPPTKPDTEVGQPFFSLGYGPSGLSR
ncbi:MAG: helix-turn-helix protein [Marmoricola sp.]|nr:helix-turn-helix protein [Marmoricola sp.]